jgi:hypothetical protein
VTILFLFVGVKKDPTVCTVPASARLYDDGTKRREEVSFSSTMTL